jgi:hypothetical protein
VSLPTLPRFEVFRCALRHSNTSSRGRVAAEEAAAVEEARAAEEAAAAEEAPVEEAAAEAARRLAPESVVAVLATHIFIAAPPLG